MKYKNIGCLLLILIVAGYFRFTGINWDQNQHLHPDERFLTMVATELTWPRSIKEYFDTAISPVNPNNKGFNFYVYGTWPVLLVKAVAQRVNMGSYDGITIVGRICSGITELLILLLVYTITQLISKKTQAGIVAAGIYACMILPIQLAHFFTVDPYVTLFLAASFLLIISMIQTSKSSMRRMYSCVLGITFGLATAAKVSAVLFIVVIAGAYIIMGTKKRAATDLLISAGIVWLLFFISLRIWSPYIFTGKIIPRLNPLFITNLQQLQAFDGVNTGFPPAFQWIPTSPVIYMATHTYFWGLGIPIGTLVVSGFILFLIQLLQKRYGNAELVLAVFWILFLFFYQSIQFAKALRYVYPVYPILAVFSGSIAMSVWEKIRMHKWSVWAICLLVFCSVWWAWGFTTIYRTPHSRVQASYWIYDHVPQESRLTYEIWDDTVPMNVVRHSSSTYHIKGLPMYDPDSPEKWTTITAILEQSDYVAITSNRLWRSLYALPHRFPNTATYYKLLFSGKLGFTNIATFTSYPCLIPMSATTEEKETNLQPSPFTVTTTPSCIFALNDDGAEESFTVYDHPKVLLFKNTTHYTKDQLFQRIYGQQ